MASSRRFTSKVSQQVQKNVIVGIDFGTSYTKVYFNQDGEVEQPLEFFVNEKNTYFLPTKLFYAVLSNKIYFKKQKGTKAIKYFKYSMISNDLITSNTLKQENDFKDVKVEFLCSVYYLAYLIKLIKEQISEILKPSDIKYTFNMGCPIENFADANKGKYDEALALGYKLSERVEDGMTIHTLYDFYLKNKGSKFKNLQTIPELYAEALWFIEQPSTGEGIYTILDIGGGTVDFASIYVSRDGGEKDTAIYSQNIVPFGIEILLQKLYPEEYEKDREKCKSQLKDLSAGLPRVWEPKHEGDRKLKVAHDFYVEFGKGILEIKERNRALMKEQNSKTGYIPYYAFGGGAKFRWYHSIIKSHARAFSGANIPPLKLQSVDSKGINNRLIIAKQLTRSSFPEIVGFPWTFPKEESPKTVIPKVTLDDKEKQIYGTK